MQELFKRYLENQCSPGEVEFLLSQFSAGRNEEILKKLIRQQLEHGNATVAGAHPEWEGILKESYSKITEEIHACDQNRIAPVIKLYKRIWFRVAAAAVLILMATGTLILLNQTSKQQQVTSHQQPDIAPGGNKAILTLADGTTVILDKVANGDLTDQGNVKVIKTDGQLVYKMSGNSKEVIYNTISTPRGGQYQLILSDGSMVWLNAESSLRFPASFVGNERRVELTGEGYFEVAPLSSKGGQKMPFIVNVAGKGEVEVLGTHFNINSYADEATINTTLLEGSVKVTPVLNSQLTTRNSQILFPGQQATLNPAGKIFLNKNVDVDEVMAWKNSIFNFSSLDIKSIMRQISRWYDVGISYEGNMSNETFSGIVSRNSNVSQVLKIMEHAGLKFRIEGKKIVVIE